MDDDSRWCPSLSTGITQHVSLLYLPSGGAVPLTSF